MLSSDDDMLRIEIAFAAPNREVIMALSVPTGTTAVEAIYRSGILRDIPEIDLAKNKIGVFGELVSHDYLLQQYDRVEIYRPLIADPKDIRRVRAGKSTQK